MSDFLLTFAIASQNLHTPFCTVNLNEMKQKKWAICILQKLSDDVK